MRIGTVVEILLAVAAIAALLISRFKSPGSLIFWVGIALYVVNVVGGFLARMRSSERRKERLLDVEPKDWTVEEEQGMLKRAWLEIPQERHGKGRDINVRIEQTDFKRWDLEEPEIRNGKVIIRYRKNNFPANPRIPLRIHISGRG